MKCLITGTNSFFSAAFIAHKNPVVKNRNYPE